MERYYPSIIFMKKSSQYKEGICNTKVEDYCFWNSVFRVKQL